MARQLARHDLIIYVGAASRSLTFSHFETIDCTYCTVLTQKNNELLPQEKTERMSNNENKARKDLSTFMNMTAKFSSTGASLFYVYAYLQLRMH